MTEPVTDPDPGADPGPDADPNIPTAPKPRVRKIVFRIVFVVGALALSFWVLAATFDDLDGAEIREAIGSLNDAELLSLGSMWLLWVGAQGLLTASLVPGLAVRHGVVAFLGPASVTSIVPCSGRTLPLNIVSSIELQPVGKSIKAINIAMPR